MYSQWSSPARTDLLSSIGVYFERFVAYGSPFVATAKAIDHGAQGLFG
jgi:hypothetical protein